MKRIILTLTLLLSAAGLSSRAQGSSAAQFLDVIPDAASLSLGGSGVISVLSNVAPRETHDMVQKFLDGDVAGSREIQLRALPLIDALFCEVNPIPVKAALNLMGKEVGPLRAPLCEMSEANAAVLAKVMKEYGIL